jgi:pimeloyl-ACP methyl ester carboxylesterase
MQPDAARNGNQRAGDRARERMLAGICVDERRLQVAGVSTTVLEGGDGPPLVLLHGGIECGGAIWAPVVHGLARSHRLLIPDLPGLGESEPLGRLDPGAFNEWFGEFLRTTCSAEPTLVAHSLAGNLAARFAAEHGDLLRALAIYAAPGVGAPYRMPFRLRVVAIRFGLRPTDRNAERFDRFALLDLDRTRERDREWFDAFTRCTMSRATVPHVKRTMRQLIKTATEQVREPALGHIAIPTTLVWGRHDRMVPVGLAQAASTRLGWQLHVVDEAAHVPHIEHPEGFLGALGSALETGVHDHAT